MLLQLSVIVVVWSELKKHTLCKHIVCFFNSDHTTITDIPITHEDKLRQHEIFEFAKLQIFGELNSLEVYYHEFSVSYYISDFHFELCILSNTD